LKLGVYFRLPIFTETSEIKDPIREEMRDEHSKSDNYFKAVSDALKKREERGHGRRRNAIAGKERNGVK